MQEQPPVKLKDRLLAWVKAHKRLAIIIGVASVLVIGGGVTALVLLSQPDPAPKVVAQPEPDEPTMPH